jgi:hypothetical protein
MTGDVVPALRPLGVRSTAWRVGRDGIDLTRSQREVRVVSVTAEPANVVLDLSRTAVVVVDVQNGFCHPDGAARPIRRRACGLRVGRIRVTAESAGRISGQIVVERGRPAVRVERIRQPVLVGVELRGARRACQLVARARWMTMRCFVDPGGLQANSVAVFSGVWSMMRMASGVTISVDTTS